jgi:hypothetical protein
MPIRRRIAAYHYNWDTIHFTLQDYVDDVITRM